MNIDVETTVGELVADKPARARVFEVLGIDYCCGGKQTLRTACLGRALDPKTVSLMLDLSAANSAATERYRDVSALTLTEFVDHIETSHHGYLRREIPRLLELSKKVSTAHGPAHEEVLRIEKILQAFSEEIWDHMAKEERVLFPAIRAMDAGEVPELPCGGLSGPNRRMEFEHDSAGRALASMSELSGRYKVPSDACNTFRALYAGLEDLEEDMHQHVHKENNVLFPRVSMGEEE